MARLGAQSVGLREPLSIRHTLFSFSLMLLPWLLTHVLFVFHFFFLCVLLSPFYAVEGLLTSIFLFVCFCLFFFFFFPHHLQHPITSVKCIDWKVEKKKKEDSSVIWGKLRRNCKEHDGRGKSACFTNGCWGSEPNRHSAVRVRRTCDFHKFSL